MLSKYLYLFIFLKLTFSSTRIPNTSYTEISALSKILGKVWKSFLLRKPVWFIVNLPTLYEPRRSSYLNARRMMGTTERQKKLENSQKHVGEKAFLTI